MDESQLIIACKKQNRNAQKALYETYAPKMMGVCMRYCKNNETARDLLHDGFIQIFTQIHSYSGKGSFEGWLRRIFVNLVLENFRREKRKNKFVEDFERCESEMMYMPEDSILDVEDISREMLLELIRELPNGYRTVFNLFIFEEMSHKEIAAQLGINEAASRSQYSRAKALLQKKVQGILQRNKAL